MHEDACVAVSERGGDAEGRAGRGAALTELIWR